MTPTIQKLKSEASDGRKQDLTLYEIHYYPADYTLKVLYDKWIQKEIVVPLFQRQYVWKRAQASKLIESFLLGLPVPGIFFYSFISCI